MFVISWKPSFILGSLNLDAKLEKAECGRIDRFSGLNVPAARALTVSLCSHSLVEAAK